jgi:spore maturation protein CgeB
VRVLVIDTYYPAFLAGHYRNDPALAGRTFEQQLQALMDRCFGTSDAYSRHFRELGHVAIDVVANCAPLQLRWAYEQGRHRAALRRFGSSIPGRAGAIAERALLRRIALDQIAAFDPDVVYLQDLWFFGEGDLDALRKAGRLVAGQIASRLPPERTLRRFDLLLTSFPHFVERFRDQGLDSEYLKIAFDLKVIEKLRDLGVAVDPAASREHRVVFVGGLDPNVHGEAIRLLERAAEETGLEVWGYGASGLPQASPIVSRYRGEAWGLGMYEVLARSQIALNRHINLADGYANNMRLYEATGVGALLVTEWAENLSNLFEPEREVIAYENADDLIAQIRRYADTDERRSIAAAGQARTLREHTYANRIAELSAMLEARLR